MGAFRSNRCLELETTGKASERASIKSSFSAEALVSSQVFEEGAIFAPRTEPWAIRKAHRSKENQMRFLQILDVPLQASPDTAMLSY